MFDIVVTATGIATLALFWLLFGSISFFILLLSASLVFESGVYPSRQHIVGFLATGAWTCIWLFLKQCLMKINKCWARFLCEVVNLGDSMILQSWWLCAVWDYVFQILIKYSVNLCAGSVVFSHNSWRNCVTFHHLRFPSHLRLGVSNWGAVGLYAFQELLPFINIQLLLPGLENLLGMSMLAQLAL